MAVLEFVSDFQKHRFFYPKKFGVLEYFDLYYINAKTGKEDKIRIYVNDIDVDTLDKFLERNEYKVLYDKYKRGESPGECCLKMRNQRKGFIFFKIFVEKCNHPFLLNYNMDLKEYTSSLFHRALFGGEFDVVEYMIQSFKQDYTEEAFVEIMNRKMIGERSPVTITLSNLDKISRKGEDVKFAKILRLLIKNGADVSKDVEAFKYVLHTQKLRLLTILLKGGFDPNQQLFVRGMQTHRVIDDYVEYNDVYITPLSYIMTSHYGMSYDSIPSWGYDNTALTKITNRLFEYGANKIKCVTSGGEDVTNILFNNRICHDGYRGKKFTSLVKNILDKTNDLADITISKYIRKYKTNCKEITDIARTIEEKYYIEQKDNLPFPPELNNLIVGYL